jgi:hypothetical protein
MSANGSLPQRIFLLNSGKNGNGVWVTIDSYGVDQLKKTDLLPLTKIHANTWNISAIYEEESHYLIWRNIPGGTAFIIPEDPETLVRKGSWPIRYFQIVWRAQ